MCLRYLCTLPWLCAFSEGYLYFQEHEIATGPVKDVRGGLHVWVGTYWLFLSEPALPQHGPFKQCLPNLLTCSWPHLEAAGCASTQASGQLCLVPGVLWGRHFVSDRSLD